MDIRSLIGERFTSVDTAWLHMDSPTNLAVITGVITFSDPLDYDAFLEILRTRLLSYPRLRQRVIEPVIGLPRWVEDPKFDLGNHFFRMSLSEPADHETLQHVVSEMMSIPLDKTKPLWELHYVDNYDQGSALICRFHHCIADGIALVQVLLSIADEDVGEHLFDSIEDPFADLSPLARLFVPPVIATRAVQRRVRKARSFVNQGIKTITSPPRMINLAKVAAAGGISLGKLLLLPPDQSTLLKDRCGIPKKAVWSKVIDVADIKKIGQSLDATINDILLAALTGAIRKYFLSREERVDGLNIRAIVPVNLRPADDAGWLGNQFGLVFLSLPVGVEDSIKRLSVLKQRMAKIKQTPEAVVALGILSTMGVSPNRIEDLIREMFGMKGSLVVTNVPGPRQALRFADVKIDGLMFWVPAPVNLSLGVSMISYAGDVMVGIATDAGIIPDPETIMDAFYEELMMLSEWEKASQVIGAAHDDEIGEMEVEKIRSEIVEHVEPAGESEESQEPGRCQALTLKGIQCKNQALQGAVFCHIHANK
ncbi:MAG: wax ester/triacylglycerol synthase family O-acyltransferase [Chloroflexota bacterium]|nr:wax ester/triacylglycerol synthase family O-acyltransferase [Chloroflexota bacterium]